MARTPHDSAWDLRAGFQDNMETDSKGEVIWGLIKSATIV